MNMKRLIYCLVFIFFLVANVSLVKADDFINNISNVKLEGNAEGIVFIPGDEPFLYKTNMVPGDKISRSIYIINEYDVSYDLYMRAERVTPKEEFDLLQKINLKIVYDDKILYEGPVSGEEGLVKNVYLGKIVPGEYKTLKAEASLDGPETSNEYKNKVAQVDWIFTAENIQVDGGGNNNNNNNSNKLPITGEDIVFGYILIGLSILGVGIILFRKGGKGDERRK